MRKLLAKLQAIQQRNAAAPLNLSGLRWIAGFLAITQLIIVVVVMAWPQRAGGLGPLAFLSFGILTGLWVDVHERISRGENKADASCQSADVQPGSAVDITRDGIS